MIDMLGAYLLAVRKGPNLTGALKKAGRWETKSQTDGASCRRQQSVAINLCKQKE